MTEQGQDCSPLGLQTEFLNLTSFEHLLQCPAPRCPGTSRHSQELLRCGSPIVGRCVPQSLSRARQNQESSSRLREAHTVRAAVLELPGGRRLQPSQSLASRTRMSGQDGGSPLFRASSCYPEATSQAGLGVEQSKALSSEFLLQGPQL